VILNVSTRYYNRLRERITVNEHTAVAEGSSTSLRRTETELPAGESNSKSFAHVPWKYFRERGEALW
jgi:hypothetical protein